MADRPGGPRRTPAPRRTVAQRRRRALLGLLAGAALVGGLLAGTGGGAPDRRTTAPATAPDGRAAAAPAAHLSLERQVGELLVVSFSGTRAPAYVTRALHDGRVAGAILFGGNAPSLASVRALTASLQRAAGGDAILCLDQEGGAIRTLRFAPSLAAQATQRTPAAAAAAATATARALRAAGVDVVLGPVADVVAGTPGSALAGRAYPGDPRAVAASVRAAARAYEQAGVAPTLKHFPGLGGARANTDAAPVAIDASDARLLAQLAPFRAPVPLVMVGHARYPALDPHAIASQSHAIATDLLRRTLGFRGVAISDSLEARAAIAAAGGDVGRAGVRSLAAGVDLLLLTGPGSLRPVRAALLAEARRSPAFRARVAQAAARVIALRRALRATP